MDEQAEDTDFNHKQIAKEIDEELEPLKFGANLSRLNFSTEDWEELFDLADEFKSLKPWEKLYDDQIIAVEIPNYSYVFCSVLGKNAEEYGLVCYVGNQGVINLRHILFDQIDSLEEFAKEQSAIQLSFSDRDELTPEDYELIKDLGRSYRGKKQWPLYRSYYPGFLPWFLNEDGVYILTNALRQIIQVFKRINVLPFELPSAFDGSIFARVRDKKASYLDQMLHLDWNAITNELDSTLYIDEFQIKKLLKQYRVMDLSFEFSTFYLEEPIQDQANEPPYFPRLFVAAERSQGLAIYYDIEPPGELNSKVQLHFIKFIENIKCIPSQIWTDPETEKHLSPLLEKLGTEIKVVKNLPYLKEIEKSFLNF